MEGQEQRGRAGKIAGSASMRHLVGILSTRGKTRKLTSVIPVMGGRQKQVAPHSSPDIPNRWFTDRPISRSRMEDERAKKKP